MVEIILIVLFFALLLLGVPVAFCIGLATAASLLMSVDLVPAIVTMAQRMVSGINSFAL